MGARSVHSASKRVGPVPAHLPFSTASSSQGRIRYDLHYCRRTANPRRSASIEPPLAMAGQRVAKPGSRPWAELLQPALRCPVTAVKERRLASLWAGYGSVSSLSLDLGPQDAQDSGPHPASSSSSPPWPSTLRLIVKDVHPPRASGISHERKLRSYAVESSFYLQLVPRLLADTGLGVPRPVLIDARPPDDFTLVLTDLSGEYPSDGDYDELDTVGEAGGADEGPGLCGTVAGRSGGLGGHSPWTCAGDFGCLQAVQHGVAS